MGDDAARLRMRMERLGISDSELERESRQRGLLVSRDTIGDIKRGKSFTRRTMARLEQMLNALEEEAGIDTPEEDDDWYEFEVRIPGEPDATVIVRRRSPEEAEEAVARLLRRLRANNET